MLLLMLLITRSFALDWNCYNYAVSYPESVDTVALSQRELYLPRLCSTIATCHSHPQLSSFRAYVHDISTCYKTHSYNFDHSLFESNRASIDGYINAHKTVPRLTFKYDLFNLRARDLIESIVKTVRLRNAYLREFRYQNIPSLSGDVALLLNHSRLTFLSDSFHQEEVIRQMSSLISNQLSLALNISGKTSAILKRIEISEQHEEELKMEFEKFEMEIRKNVIGSLLELHDN